MFLYLYKKLSYLTQLEYIKYIIVIFIISSCDSVNIDKIDEDISEFMDWSFGNTVIQTDKDVVPISSKTLNSFITMDQEYLNFDFIFIDKNNIIGVFIFKDMDYELFGYKNNIMLISRAQKLEKFNIKISSNRNKNKSSFLLDKIEEMLMLEGVNKKNISKEYADSGDESLIIKLVKVN